jgi:hypothetical protein
MERTENDSALSKIRAAIDKPAELLAAAEGRAFTYTVVDPDSGLAETVAAAVDGGTVRITSYTVAAPQGQYLALSSRLRKEVLEGTEVLVVQELARELVGGRWSLQHVGDHLAALDGAPAAASALAHASRETRRRNDWTPQRLAELADVYRRAAAEGRPPRLACADHFQLAPATVSRAIRLARDAGILEDTPDA